jgi:3',5'-cyclic AMP phosphodiesterase CpdA
MKIAHLSDLHLDAKNKQENLYNFQKLLEHISRSSYDHVIITGDITENAEDSAFELARGLFKVYGLLDHRKLTVTIGNHDIFGGVHLAEDVLNFPAKCRAVDFDEKVKKFCKYFGETFESTLRPADDRFFPFIKVLDDVVLAGLNSIAEYSALKNPFASNGKISSAQTDEMTALLEKARTAGQKTLIVTHHHFCRDSLDVTSSSGSIWQAIEKQTMKLRNKKRIIKRLKKTGAEYVLHGHLHETASYTRKELNFLNAGGTLLGNKPGVLKFNEIEISKGEISHKTVILESAGNPHNKTVKIFPSVYPLPKRIPARNVISMN